MGVRDEDVELARARLFGILVKARKLELPAEEVLATRPARKLIARTSGPLGRYAVRLGLLALVLAGLYLYARWPTHADYDTVRTVLRSKSCATGDMADRVAALIYTSTSAQSDDC